MKVAIYLSVLICFLKFSTLAFASQKIEVEHYQAQQLVKGGEILSLDVTLAGIQTLCHGKLIDAHLYQQNGHWRYELQIRTIASQLVDLTLDAKSGQLTHPTKLPSSCIAKPL
ncbi:PepSY domain-containing protein [Shewanella kaireitica]|uniref:PepSY domain-containing protein n=1 Tax=Shewanella kaireitica TaxID=212021 RepID=UPI00201034EC|nr:hypothetical protein [Shewanella kaireitica]MCL1093011.1 hypothetical protein [Shewanella kaireitica]